MENLNVSQNLKKNGENFSSLFKIDFKIRMAESNFHHRNNILTLRK